MKKLLSFLCVGSCVLANAGVGQHHSLNGFEKCLQQQGMSVSVSEGNRSYRKYVEKSEIQDQCVENAATQLKSEKSSKVFLDYIVMTKRYSNPITALPIVIEGVKKAVSICNEMAVYEVFLKSLSFPYEGRPKDKIFNTTQEAIEICLKDKTFRKDFMEELQNSDATIAQNACQILLSAKVVNQCKKG